MDIGLAIKMNLFKNKSFIKNTIKFNSLEIVEKTCFDVDW